MKESYHEYICEVTTGLANPFNRKCDSDSPCSVYSVFNNGILKLKIHKTDEFKWMDEWTGALH